MKQALTLFVVKQVGRIHFAYREDLGSHQFGKLNLGE